MEAEKLIGQRVTVRTKEGMREGRVKEEITKAEAEARIGGKLKRNGRYLVVDGVDHPVRRNRCRPVRG